MERAAAPPKQWVKPPRRRRDGFWRRLGIALGFIEPTPPAPAFLMKEQIAAESPAAIHGNDLGSSIPSSHDARAWAEYVKEFPNDPPLAPDSGPLFPRSPAGYGRSANAASEPTQRSSIRTTIQRPMTRSASLREAVPHFRPAGTAQCAVRRTDSRREMSVAAPLP